MWNWLFQSRHHTGKMTQAKLKEEKLQSLLSKKSQKLRHNPPMHDEVNLWSKPTFSCNYSAKKTFWMHFQNWNRLQAHQKRTRKGNLWTFMSYWSLTKYFGKQYTHPISPFQRSRNPFIIKMRMPEIQFLLRIKTNLLQLMTIAW